MPRYLAYQHIHTGGGPASHTHPGHDDVTRSGSTSDYPRTSTRNNVGTFLYKEHCIVFSSERNALIIRRIQLFGLTFPWKAMNLSKQTEAFLQPSVSDNNQSYLHNRVCLSEACVIIVNKRISLSCSQELQPDWSLLRRLGEPTLEGRPDIQQPSMNSTAVTSYI